MKPLTEPELAARAFGVDRPEGGLLTSGLLEPPTVDARFERRESPRTNERARLVVHLLVAGWCLAVAAGMGWLWRYKSTPGGATDPVAEWPAASPVPRAPSKATVVMIAHPQCPCTTASVDELALLMARVSNIATAHVLFVKPAATPPGWNETGLWSRAERIPGVTVSWDEGGREARAFGALTSGHTVVYDVAGRLVFRGGITSARGHAGDNAGRHRIVALLTVGEADRRDSLVYGCALEDAPEGR